MPSVDCDLQLHHTDKDTAVAMTMKRVWLMLILNTLRIMKVTFTDDINLAMTVHIVNVNDILDRPVEQANYRPCRSCNADGASDRGFLDKPSKFADAVNEPTNSIVIFGVLIPTSMIYT